MDESFREVLKKFQLPERGTEDILGTLAAVLGLLMCFVIMYLVHSVMTKRSQRRAIQKSAQAKGLSPEERAVIMWAVNTKPRMNPFKVLHSLREFQRLFGTLMHDLVGKLDTERKAQQKLNLIFSVRKKLFGDVAYHFGPLSSTLQLAAGQHLMLKFHNQGRTTSAGSVVLDVDSTAITVDYPFIGGERPQFEKGQPVEVILYRDRDAEYQFKTHVLRDTVSRDQLFLMLAHAANVERLQMRKFYRLETQVPFKFSRYLWDSKLDNRYLPGVEDDSLPFEGTIQDISAGGIMFSTREPLNSHDLVVFNLELDHRHTIHKVLGKVVAVNRQGVREDEYLVRIGFLNIKTGDQDLIIRTVMKNKPGEDEEPE